MSYQLYSLLVLLVLTPYLHAGDSDKAKALKRVSALVGHLKVSNSQSTGVQKSKLPPIPSEWQQSALAKWEPARLKELAGWVRKKSQNSDTDYKQAESPHKKS